MADKLRPLTADEIQDPDNPVRMLAESHEESLKRKYATALAVLAGAMGVDAVIAAYAARNRAALLAAIFDAGKAFDQFEAALQPALDQISQIMETIAEAEAENIAPGFRYDPLYSGRRQLIEAFQGQILSEFKAKTVQTVDLLYAKATAGDMDAEAFSRLMAEAGSLAPQQAQAIINYRSLLENGDVAALQRALRDQRYDALIREAARGRALRQAQIDAMVKAYADRYAAHRAANLAADVAMSAASQSARQSWREAAAKGFVSPSEVRRFWQTAGDELVCPFCQSVPLLNTEGVGLHDQYRTINGRIDGPQAHSKCRCTEKFEVLSLTGHNSLRNAI